MDVIPHYELAEREVAQDCLLYDVPVLLFHYLSSDGVEHQRGVDAAVILRQRIKAADGDVEHLAEQLKQGDVKHRVLVPASEDIAAGS